MRSGGGLLAEWAVGGVGFLAGGAELDGAETGRRPVGEAPPPGRVVRSKGTGEAASARSERAGWTEWVVRGRRHRCEERCFVGYWWRGVGIGAGSFPRHTKVLRLARIWDWVSAQAKAEQPQDDPIEHTGTDVI